MLKQTGFCLVLVFIGVTSGFVLKDDFPGSDVTSEEIDNAPWHVHVHGHWHGHHIHVHYHHGHLHIHYHHGHPPSPCASESEPVCGGEGDDKVCFKLTDYATTEQGYKGCVEITQHATEAGRKECFTVVPRTDGGNDEAMQLTWQRVN